MSQLSTTLSTVTADPEAISEALCGVGACRIEAPFSDLAGALAAEARTLHRQGALQAARVGRGVSHQGNSRIRGDGTRWLDDPACIAGRRLLERLETLGDGLRESLRMPIRSVEAHYAHYPVGAAYARHRDRFRDSGSRLVSWVGYLNPDWRAELGGQLRIHFDDDAFVDTLPMIDTAVCFLSELEHEVLPATQDRYSIAAWFRRD